MLLFNFVFEISSYTVASLIQEIGYIYSKINQTNVLIDTKKHFGTLLMVLWVQNVFGYSLRRPISDSNAGFNTRPTFE